VPKSIHTAFLYAVCQPLVWHTEAGGKWLDAHEATSAAAIHSQTARSLLGLPASPVLKASQRPPKLLVPKESHFRGAGGKQSGNVGVGNVCGDIGLKGTG